MTLTAYTDASYRERLDIAACGYMVYNNGILIKNSVVVLGNIETIANAEIYSIEQALIYCFLQNGVSKIYIYTDQKQVCFGERNILRRKNRYKEMYAIIDIIEEHGIEVKFSKVRSHGTNEIHNHVDSNCTDVLNKYLKSFPELTMKVA